VLYIVGSLGDEAVARLGLAAGPLASICARLYTGVTDPNYAACDIRVCEYQTIEELSVRFLAEARNSFHVKLLECLRTCFTQVPELARDNTRRSKTTGDKCGKD
jgi:hypothetical protein